MYPYIPHHVPSTCTFPIGDAGLTTHKFKSGELGMRSIMKELGGNDYKQAHNGGIKRKRDVGASVDLSIDLNDYDRCMEFINE